MRKRQIYEIREEDVGNNVVKVECNLGHPHVLHLGGELGFMGRVLDMDVGKRVYLVDGTHYVENQEQLERRLNDE